MLPENRIPTHPGEVLQEEFLVPMGLSPASLTAYLGIPVQQIDEIVRGEKGLTPETAWLFSQAFGTTPEFWTTLQANYDLATHRPERRVARLKAS